MVKIYDMASHLASGQLYRVIPNVYAMVIADKYDRAMLFCRYQEFYESPFDNIRGKYFTLEEYMRQYTKHYNADMFTYPSDWEGYNIPSHVLSKAVERFENDTYYDMLMQDVYYTCKEDCNDKFYLIGTDKVDSLVMKHELAHALWYVNKKYKTSAQRLVNAIPKEDYAKLYMKIKKMGYADDVIDDEIQAYMSTTWRNKYADKFKKHFNKHLN